MIISSVHGKSASKILGTSAVMLAAEKAIKDQGSKIAFVTFRIRIAIRNQLSSSVGAGSGAGGQTVGKK